jgi:hypothetical protein
MALVVWQADRVLLHPVVSRAGNAVFLGGIVAAVVQWAMGAGVLTVLTVVLLAVGVVLMGAPALRRLLHARQEPTALPKPEAPGGIAEIEQPSPAVDGHEDVQPDVRAALNRLIRQGAEIEGEAEMAGHAADSTLDRRSPADVAVDLENYGRHEQEWTERVEDLLADHPDLPRFSEASGLSATSHYAIKNRLEARLPVLREIRNALTEPEAPTASDPRPLVSRLRETIREGAELRDKMLADPLTRLHLPLDMADYEAKAERWTKSVGQLLESSGHDREAGEFLAPVERSPLAGVLGGNERDRLSRTLRTRVGRLQRIAERLQPADRVQLLREAYTAGVGVRNGNVWTEGAPVTEEESQEGKRRAWESAAEWGFETWEMLLQHFPGHAERAFFGDPSNYALGKVGFQMNAYAERDAGSTVDSYMESKLAILADLLERERP